LSVYQMNVNVTIPASLFVRLYRKYNENLEQEMALLHELRFRHKLPLPDNGLKDTLSDWRTQMSETV